MEKHQRCAGRKGTHDNVDYKIARTRVLTNQAGYGGKAGSGFDAGLIVEV